EQEVRRRHRPLERTICGPKSLINPDFIPLCPGSRSSREGAAMLAPDEKLKLSPKPYLSATGRFASGADTPRDFLERCLADLAAPHPNTTPSLHLHLPPTP